MAAHRYWRAVGFVPYGNNGLELTELQLFAGGARADASATLTSNIAPATGTLAYLADNSALNSATWPAASMSTLALTYDLGSPVAVDDIQLGAGVDATRYALVVKLQWSDDAATWTDYVTVSGLRWPGDRKSVV